MCPTKLGAPEQPHLGSKLFDISENVWIQIMNFSQNLKEKILKDSSLFSKLLFSNLNTTLNLETSMTDQLCLSIQCSVAFF